MPWRVQDVEKHKKGLSQDQKRKWVRIANKILDEDGDESKAVKVANSQVGSGTRK